MSSGANLKIATKSCSNVNSIDFDSVWNTVYCAISPGKYIDINNSSRVLNIYKLYSESGFTDIYGSTYIHTLAYYTGSKYLTNYGDFTVTVLYT